MTKDYKLSFIAKNRRQEAVPVTILINFNHTMCVIVHFHYFSTIYTL